MSRKARILSETKIYHIILRGINRQIIFWDAEDRARFLDRLSYYKGICGYELFAYCLMDNHIHLLIKEGKEPLHKVFRRLLDSYVFWYNAKHDRCGNLFQDRFKSEPVNDERYFIKVVHYILHNPVIAGICASPEEYEYSSAAEYIFDLSGITDVDYVLEMMGRKTLKKYLKDASEDDIIKNQEDHRVLVKVNDKNAMEIITEKLGAKIPVDQEILKRNIRLFLARGISLRQISRITSLSRTVLYRLLKEE
ncbi:MAG: transposase [Lachnospiraceae bacterium]|nr:transposase [Lachnospiraceae bacterium]